MIDLTTAPRTKGAEDKKTRKITKKTNSPRRRSPDKKRRGQERTQRKDIGNRFTLRLKAKKKRQETRFTAENAENPGEITSDFTGQAQRKETRSYLNSLEWKVHLCGFSKFFSPSRKGKRIPQNRHT